MAHASGATNSTQIAAPFLIRRRLRTPQTTLAQCSRGVTHSRKEFRPQTRQLPEWGGGVQCLLKPGEIRNGFHDLIDGDELSCSKRDAKEQQKDQREDVLRDPITNSIATPQQFHGRHYRESDRAPRSPRSYNKRAESPAETWKVHSWRRSSLSPICSPPAYAPQPPVPFPYSNLAPADPRPKITPYSTCFPSEGEVAQQFPHRAFRKMSRPKIPPPSPAELKRRSASADPGVTKRKLERKTAGFLSMPPPVYAFASTADTTARSPSSSIPTEWERPAAYQDPHFFRERGTIKNKYVVTPSSCQGTRRDATFLTSGGGNAGHRAVCQTW